MGKEIVNLAVDKNYNVVMANELAKSQSKMQPKDAIFVRYLISQISMHDTDIQPYRLSVDDIRELLNYETTNLYRDVKNMATRIMKSVVSINTGNDKYELYHWVDYCKYEGGYLTVKIAEDLKPYLIGLKKYFTKYEFEHIRKMKSYQTIGLYELIVDALGRKKFEHRQEVKIETPVIKRKLGLLNKYTVFKLFQDRVVEKACEEIRNNGIFWIDAIPYKSGRCYAGFTFIIEGWNTHKIRIAKEENERKAAELREKEKETSVNEEEPDNQMSLYDITGDNRLLPNEPSEENKKVIIEGPNMDMMGAVTVLRQNPDYTIDNLVELGYSREVAATAYAINLTYNM